MRLRFPELKGAANALEKYLDKDFLEGKWGEPSDRQTPLPEYNEVKSSIYKPSTKLIQTHRAYSPFIDNHLTKSTNQKKISLGNLLVKISRDQSLKKKIHLDELIAQLFLGVKKLHEKNLVLRNINIYNVSVIKNSFGSYHLKFNTDLLAVANDMNLETKELHSFIRSIPPELCIHDNLNDEFKSERIAINALKYRTINKIYLDGYALGKLLDILRETFQSTNPKLLKLISSLTTEPAKSYQSVEAFFYEYFQPNHIFYLNMITRKFAESHMFLRNNDFLNGLLKLKTIYWEINHLFDFINQSKDKNDPSVIFQKLIKLKNELETIKDFDFKSSAEIIKIIETINNLTDKIIEYYKKILLEQLGNLINSHVRYSYSEQLKFNLQKLFSEPNHLDYIKNYLFYLFDKNMLVNLNPYMTLSELMTILVILKANVERYIQKYGFIAKESIIHTLQINFILAYKLHMDKVIKMEFWSKLFNNDVKILKENEREFLNNMDHELIYDPYCSLQIFKKTTNRQN